MSESASKNHGIDDDDKIVLGEPDKIGPNHFTVNLKVKALESEHDNLLALLALLAKERDEFGKKEISLMVNLEEKDKALRSNDIAWARNHGLIVDRNAWKAKAEALAEALRKMLSPEMDWENGEIGVGNNFRSVAFSALAAFTAETKNEA